MNMDARSAVSRTLLTVAVILFVFCIAPAPARANLILFSLSDTTLNATSGGNVVFDGTVTNNSGTDLNASDFFFNFSGYDFTSVFPNQDLGVSSDFLIPNEMTSPTVALFDVTLADVPDGTSFPIQVQLEDVNNDLSATQTVTVSVSSGATAAPEPQFFWPLAAVFLAMAYRLRRPCTRKKEF
jgi:hypothetical protein